MAVIATNLFNLLATLYFYHITKIQWNASYSILLLYDWFLKQFDIKMLWYLNWHGTVCFPAPQLEFCNLLCYFFKPFIRMHYFLGSGYPSTNILRLLYIRYLNWNQWYYEYFEKRIFQFSIIKILESCWSHQFLLQKAKAFV